MLVYLRIVVVLFDAPVFTIKVSQLMWGALKSPPRIIGLLAVRGGRLERDSSKSCTESIVLEGGQ